MRVIENGRPKERERYRYRNHLFLYSILSHYLPIISKLGIYWYLIQIKKIKKIIAIELFVFKENNYKGIIKMVYRVCPLGN